MALLACLLGYGEVGLWLKKQAASPNSKVTLAGNPYLHWIEDYSGGDYQRAIKVGMGKLRRLCRAQVQMILLQTPSKLGLWPIRHRLEDTGAGAMYGLDVHALRRNSGIWPCTAPNLNGNTNKGY
jgi:hypothetical protein